MPEGWWHQVDSSSGTIAVNFWWRSAFDASLGSHMDAYRLRRLAQSLTDARKQELLAQAGLPSSSSSSRAEAPAAHARTGSAAGVPPSPAAEQEQERTEHAAGPSSSKEAAGQREGDRACSRAERENGDSASAEDGREAKRQRRFLEEDAEREQDAVERLAVAISGVLAASAEREAGEGSAGAP